MSLLYSVNQLLQKIQFSKSINVSQLKYFAREHKIDQISQKYLIN